DGRSLTFFPDAGGQAALVGIDLEAKPGVRPWRIAVVERGREPRTARGAVRFEPRRFPVEHLTLPRAVVDLDPEAERRALAEAQRLTTLLKAITAERLWRGRFTRPVAGTEPGTGFGARRIINGSPRSPHGGIDYSAPPRTCVPSAPPCGARLDRLPYPAAGTPACAREKLEGDAPPEACGVGGERGVGPDGEHRAGEERAHGTPRDLDRDRGRQGIG